MSSSGEAETPRNAPRAGEVFAARYVVERLLGVGGMGFVFAAIDGETGVRVAIKRLLPTAASDPETVKRFLREAKAASKIESEHVARVLECAALPDESPYIVMEYLEGMDLAHVLESRGRIDPEQAVDWVLEACDAIASAHAASLVHRDLKPSNLFLEATSEGARVKVLDFGISKTLGDVGTSMKMTKTSTLLGSPLYMSPEQLTNARDIDQRSDIWALGVILFELMSGRPPFDAPSLPELGVLILSRPAPDLAARVPKVSEELAAIVATCLQVDRQNRFRNLADFADAIAPHGSATARAAAAKVVARLGLPAKRATLAARPVSGASLGPMSERTAALAETIAAVTTDSGPGAGRRRIGIAIGSILAFVAAGAFYFTRAGEGVGAIVPESAVSAPAAAATAEAPVVSAPVAPVASVAVSAPPPPPSAAEPARPDPPPRASGVSASVRPPEVSRKARVAPSAATSAAKRNAPPQPAEKKKGEALFNSEQ